MSDRNLDKLTWRDLEQSCVDDFKRANDRKIYTAGRYGVSCVPMECACGARSYRAIQSKPDFEGILHATGQQFTWDAKLASIGTLKDIRSSKTKSRQVTFMLERSEFSAICFFLIHYNRREFKRKATEERMTVAIPVHREHPLWHNWGTEESTASINYETAKKFGIKCPWYTPGRTTKPRLDIHSTVVSVAESLY